MKRIIDKKSAVLARKLKTERAKSRISPDKSPERTSRQGGHPSIRAQSDKRFLWLYLVKEQKRLLKNGMPSWLSVLRFKEYDYFDDVVVLWTVYKKIAEEVDCHHKTELFGMWKHAEQSLQVKKPAKNIVIHGLMDREPSSGGTMRSEGLMLYQNRGDKSEKAPEFLKRVYAEELAEGALTLSDLRQRDKSLWAGLRNWANAGKHDLEAIIPRGVDRRGRPPLVPAVDPDTLNPDDPRDALALRAIRQRMADRVRLQKWRAAKAENN